MAKAMSDAVEAALPGVLTLRELAKKARLSETTVRREALAGNIPGLVRIGRQWRIAERNADAWLGADDNSRRSEPAVG